MMQLVAHYARSRVVNLGGQFALFALYELDEQGEIIRRQ